MGFKDFIHKLKLFAWFIITEPLRQLKEIFKLFLKILGSLNKTLTWAYIAIIALIISLFLGNNAIAGILLAFFLFIVLLWEWERGFFIYRHRQVTRERLKKEAWKKLNEQHGDDYKDGDDWTEQDSFKELNNEEIGGKKKNG